MGVYIENMEMPGMGFREIRIHPNGTATECLEGYEVNVGKAVPVPPHGRLIDANELHSALRKRAKEFSNSEYGEGVKCGLADAREYIKIAPTIIPADPAEEGE